MDSRTSTRHLRGLMALGAAAVSMWAFFDAGKHYDGFWIPQAGVTFVRPEELAFFVWFSFWGLLGTVSFAAALWWLGAAEKLPGLWRSFESL